MRVLLAPFGSHGDVHPLVAVGRGLRDRGHHVTLIALPTFGPLADANRFDFAPVGTQADYDAQTRHPDLWHPTRSLDALFGGDLFARATRETYHRLADLYVPGQTVAVAGSLALSARVAQDRLGLPVATVHLQPSSYPSVTDPPVFAQMRVRRWWPHWYRRLLYWVGNRLVLGKTIGKAVNDLRRDVGLPPEPVVFGRWRHSPQLILGLFPDWYASARDWPAHFHRVGFVRYDRAEIDDVPWDVRGFLDDGPKPVVFTFGSAMRQGRAYFAAAAKACQLLGVRGLLLGHGRDQMPDPLPGGVMHADYAPFGGVFPRAAAVVHHGGIGTIAQALAAGVPQLTMPMAFDQPDNAARLEYLGVGRTVVPAAFAPEAVAATLRDLTESRAVAAACSRAAARCQDGGSVDRACRLLELLQGSDRASNS